MYEKPRRTQKKEDVGKSSALKIEIFSHVPMNNVVTCVFICVFFIDKHILFKKINFLYYKSNIKISTKDRFDNGTRFLLDMSNM